MALRPLDDIELEQFGLENDAQAIEESAVLKPLFAPKEIERTLNCSARVQWLMTLLRSIKTHGDLMQNPLLKGQMLKIRQDYLTCT